MPLIVQKFGGTSVADVEKILAAARKAVRSHQEGNQVVVVVSAMGKNTDLLVDLADQICDDPPAREMDMLLSTGEQVSVALMAMAIHSLECEAVSLTGAQIGIQTDSSHQRARIRSISTDRMRGLLDEGKIVIAAGFQGVDQQYNITTLGRGGSDTTAVALAAVLGADACEIYTDVDGVYTTDPRILPDARQVPRVSYDEMLELASLGAGVMHNRSIEFAKKFSVPIHVRSSFSDVPGTVIGPHPESADRPVSGAALTRDEARVTIEGVVDRPGVSSAIFSKIAARDIPVDMIVQNVGNGGRATVSFTVLQSDLATTLEVVRPEADLQGATSVSHDDQVSKISVVGLGMAAQTGVAEKMFRALADKGINIQIITTSEIKISVLVARDQAREALHVVHNIFQLHHPPSVKGDEVEDNRASGVIDAADVIDRLQGMEELTIDEVRADESQARITITGILDQPGIAASIFETVAQEGVFVDMIVQSFGHDGKASISFTAPREQLELAVKASTAIAKQLGCGSVTSSKEVAKLSVFGIGMRSHSGVAVRMFQALAGSDINVDMINTSEMGVNVVVDGKAGQKGLAALEQAMADVRR